MERLYSYRITLALLFRVLKEIAATNILQKQEHAKYNFKMEDLASNKNT